MHNEWEPSDSLMVDVGTFGIDRGEDDYTPTDEYDPSDGDFYADPDYVAANTQPDPVDPMDVMEALADVLKAEKSLTPAQRTSIFDGLRDELFIIP